MSLSRGFGPGTPDELVEQLEAFNPEEPMEQAAVEGAKALVNGIDSVDCPPLTLSLTVDGRVVMVKAEW